MIVYTPSRDKVVELERTYFHELDEYDFHHVIEQTHGASIVFFSKRGCSSCKAWNALLAEYTRCGYNTKVFRVDTEENMALSHEYELFHLPALFLFLNGQFHCELQSEARLEDFISVIERACASPAQEAP